VLFAVTIWRHTVPKIVFLATDLAKAEVPLNSIWLQNLAKKGSEFFSVAKVITSKSPNLAKSPAKKIPAWGMRLCDIQPFKWNFNGCKAAAGESRPGSRSSSRSMMFYDSTRAALHACCTYYCRVCCCV
jgi:hypothetical protein